MKFTVCLILGIFASLGNGMTISDRGLDLIKSFEGWRPNAYWDSYGKVWTIGYGTTRYENGRPVRQGDTITLARGLQLLRNQVNNKYGSQVLAHLGSTRVNQNQFDALTSFSYNLGGGILRGSTMLAKIKRNSRDPSIRNEFMKYVHAGGVRLPGLVSRRKAEADLYFS